MSSVISQLKRFLRDEDGPTAVEYAVMLLLIFLVCLAAITILGSNTSASFNNSSQTIQTSVSTAFSGS